MGFRGAASVRLGGIIWLIADAVGWNCFGSVGISIRQLVLCAARFLSLNLINPSHRSAYIEITVILVVPER